MASFLSITEQNVSVGLLILVLIGFTSHRVYSIYFGPLAKFPGPKLAAATLWYEFYYDVILTGQYTFKIKELHQKYGIGLLIPCYNRQAHRSRPHYSYQSI
jgi:hypothetical protein